MGNYSIRKTDRREGLYGDLEEATGRGHTSQALDRAAEFYLQMHGHNSVNPTTGKIGRLMEVAAEQGSVTPEQIADILGCEQFPVEYEHEWSIGD